MELREAMGRRRSIRFLRPYRPVEPEKIQLMLEAARSLARRAGVYNGSQAPGLVQYSIASKVFATNTAFEVASEAVQIFGGNGLTREYPVEKLMRDARASMIEDGCNHILSLAGADRL